MLFYINFKYLHNKFIIQYIILTRYGNTIHLIRGRNILDEDNKPTSCQIAANKIKR